MSLGGAKVFPSTPPAASLGTMDQTGSDSLGESTRDGTDPPRESMARPAACRESAGSGCSGISAREITVFEVPLGCGVVSLENQGRDSLLGPGHSMRERGAFGSAASSSNPSGKDRPLVIPPSFSDHMRVQPPGYLFVASTVPQAEQVGTSADCSVERSGGPQAFIGTPPAAVGMEPRGYTYANGGVCQQPNEATSIGDQVREQVFGSTPSSQIISSPLMTQQSMEDPLMYNPRHEQHRSVLLPVPRRRQPMIPQEPMAGGSCSAAFSSLSPRTEQPQEILKEPAAIRRVAEWERQIESLDQKEMEIHQTQLRLIREQSCAFRGELLQQRQELLELRARDEERAAAQLRLERQLREDSNRAAMQKLCIDKCGQEVEMSRSRLEQLRNTVSEHHALLARLNELHSTVADHHVVLSQTQGTSDQIRQLDKAFHDLTDSHGQSLRDAQMRLEDLQKVITTLDDSCKELQVAQNTIANDRADFDRRQGSMGEQLGLLEKLLGDSFEGHAQEIKNLKSLHGRHVNDTQSVHGSLHAVMEQERQSREQHKAEVAALMNSVENSLCEAHDKHAMHAIEMEAVRGNHDSIASGHASVAERLNSIEEILCGYSEKHVQDMSTTSNQLDQIHSRLTGVEMQGSTLEVLRKSHTALAKEKSELNSSQTLTQERVDQLERAILDSSERWVKEVDELRAAIRTIVSDGKARDKGHDDFKERLELSARNQEALYGRHSTFEERMAVLELMLADCTDKQAAEVASLKAVYSKHAVESQAREAMHATVTERLAHLERVLGETSDRCDQELRGTHSRIEQVHGRVQEERKARELHHGATRDLIANEKERQELDHANMEERLVVLERAFSDFSGKCVRELNDVKNNHTRHVEQVRGYQTRHKSVEERIEYIENWFQTFRPQ